ncbi:methyltransferase domain-containing protein [Iocasia frigidifontis]|uniref:Methyltransferase domain-containing protein n=1 Tax=Iocasia fonsfrigidae TaxID=2682810 RepID=A0A8A7KEI5_9FIRM|nr:class I SAM-dependent methyltransferase [Iocasia fonsfrigidae]QTL97859.1 methyltransferase domain-containing protein [Iocasia fonsfrigidae]
MNKQEEIKFFNKNAKSWTDDQNSIDVAKDFIDRLKVENDTVLDVGAGTGILYRILKKVGISKYIGIDIAENMIKEFTRLHPEADVRQADYESRISLDENFDIIIIFDSIPHFKKLDNVFDNSYNNLKSNGKFIIVHSKTREELKKHHKKIGYKPVREPIPNDETLISLSKKYNFKNIRIENKSYFMFICEKE